MFWLTSLSWLLLGASVVPIHAQIETASMSFAQVLKSNKNLTMFHSLMMENYTDIVSIIEAQHSNSNPITILAFSNQAFEKIPNSLIGTPFADGDKASVRSILLYHMIPGAHSTSTFTTNFEFLPTWLDDSSFANVSTGQVISVVEQTPYYIFVSGVGTRSTVTTADIEFAGGVIHIIDQPLIPPISYPATAEAFNTTAFLGASFQNMTLAQLMNFTTDITIFAPDNTAFQAVDTSPVLLDNATLSELVDYHIILSPLGPLYSSLLTNGTVITTVQGANLTVTFNSNSIFIGNARVLAHDLLLANGVLHVLDTVLNYNASGALPNPALPTQAPILPLGTATPLGLVPFTSAAPCLTCPPPTSTSSKSAAATTNAAAATSDLSAATTTDSSMMPTHTKKGAGSRTVFCGSSLAIVILVAVALLL